MTEGNVLDASLSKAYLRLATHLVQTVPNLEGLRTLIV